MVTAYINEEFAKIHEEEKGEDKVKKLDTTQKKSSKTRNRIIEIMRNKSRGYTGRNSFFVRYYD